MGGIMTAEDALEFILAGASSLQVCSAVMENGYKCVEAMNKGLLKYMEEMGFETISDFVGKALPNITAHNNLSRTYKLHAECDETKCIGCSRCVAVCSDSAYSAISMDGKHASVDAAKCDGCGLCTQVCPAGALSMKVR